jgi:hypothetical protein
METKIFNLEKIKEITNPIEELQGKTNHLEKIHEEFVESTKSIGNLSYKEEYINQIQVLTEILNQIKEDLFKISNDNIAKFLVFQDNLIKKYMESFKESLKHLNLSENSSRQIGLFLIENKKISKIIDKSSFINSLSFNQWIQLLNSLNKNSLFLTSINKITEFYNAIMKKRLASELNKIPEHIDPILIEEYKTSFKTEEKTFDQYLQEIEGQLTREELKSKRKIVQKIKEKEELDELKKEQDEQFRSSTYQDYIKLSSAEFDRRRRKQRREKLSDLKNLPTKDIEINDEVAEKIEQYKSQLKKSFEQEYLIQKDEDTDPLDVIRERKDKADKEYKKYIKKFKEKE